MRRWRRPAGRQRPGQGQVAEPTPEESVDQVEAAVLVAPDEAEVLEAIEGTDQRGCESSGRSCWIVLLEAAVCSAIV